MGTAIRTESGASLRLLPSGRRMTRDEFDVWEDEDMRAEWVDGEVIAMAPESLKHNDLVGMLYLLMHTYAQSKNLGRVNMEMIVVRFDALRRRRCPDLVFVSKRRLGIVKERYIQGAPDMVVEVVSPDSVARDYREKYYEYEAAGVREYWIVNPKEKRLEAHRLRKGKYVPIPERDGRVTSAALKGFFIKPEWLWQEPLPKWLKLLKELGVR